MSSPEEQKAELQPVHRVFLGELFVFVFFFAGAMSVLVGPLAVPVATAGMTIGAAVVLSGLCFLWLAFTTPMRKVEPRYAFMVLSLLPGLMICGGVLGVIRLKITDPEDVQSLQLLFYDHSKTGPTLSQLNGQEPIAVASTLFADEIGALEDVLKEFGFSEHGFDATSSKYYGRPDSKNARAFAIKTKLSYDIDDPTKPGVYSFNIVIPNFEPNRASPYFEVLIDEGLKEFSDQLAVEWLRKVKARKQAKESAN